MDKVFFISQHNFGIGDYSQINKIANYIVFSNNLKVWHFSGGNNLRMNDDTDIIKIQLPSITRIRPGSGDLKSIENKNIAVVNKERAKILLDHFKREKPKLIVTGFFPFSMHRLDSTVIPLLNYIKEYHTNTKVLCSIRDIPVSDFGPFLVDSYNNVNLSLKEYNYEVVHHTDYNIIGLQHVPYLKEALDGIKTHTSGFLSFSRMDKGNEVLNSENRFDYLIMVGGGWDGKKVIDLSCNEILKNEPDSKVLAICGPRMSWKDVQYLKAKFSNVTFKDKVNSTAKYIGYSKIVISMAGCSSVPEILYYKKPCILLPRKGSFEQQTRAECFDKYGSLVYYNIESDNSLYNSITKLKAKRLNYNINLNGLENTLKIIENMLIS